MPAKNLMLYKKAYGMRLCGNSYGVISRKCNVPKSTLSGWFSKQAFSVELKNQLDKKTRIKNSANISLMNARRLSIMHVRHNLYRLKAKEDYQTLKNKPLFIAGLALYWGEGTKVGNNMVSIINCDSDLMELAVLFFLKVLKIPESKLRGALFVYNDINIEEALAYWSEKLKIPRSYFIKTQVLPSRSVLTKRKVKNGICKVYFSSTETNLKIKEWLKLLTIDLRA